MPKNPPPQEPKLGEQIVPPPGGQTVTDPQGDGTNPPPVQGPTDQAATDAGNPSKTMSQVNRPPGADPDTSSQKAPDMVPGPGPGPGPVQGNPGTTSPSGLSTSPAPGESLDTPGDVPPVRDPIVEDDLASQLQDEPVEGAALETGAEAEADTPSILLEDGTLVTAQGPLHPRERRVRSLAGANYEHVGETADGTWTYRQM